MALIIKRTAGARSVTLQMEALTILTLHRP